MRIGFSYPNKGKKLVTNEETGLVVNLPLTVCEIEEVRGLNVDVVASAGAKCALGDRFEKEVGRKIALTRALALLNLPKSVRQNAWLAYFGRNN